MFKIRLAALLAAFGAIGAAAGTITCEKNDFRGHLQGIAADSSGIYWSFYDAVIKTDYTGRVIASVKAPRHTGDPCLAEGRLYVPIILYDRRDIKREGGTGWVYVYDTELKFLGKIALPDAPRPGSMTFHDGRFYIGGSDFGKTPHPVNPVYVYDREFKLERKVIVDIGVPTRYGPQTLNVADGRILAAFYAKAPGSFLLSVPELKVEKAFPTSVSVGFAFVPVELSGGRKLVLIGRSTGRRGAYGAKLLIREWRDDKLVDAELAKP